MFEKYLSKNLRFSISAALALVGLTLLALIGSTPIEAQKYFGSPVTKARLINVIKSKAASVPEIVKTIRESGVNFQVTSAIEGELLAARARPQIIEAARNNYRAPAGSATTARNTGGSAVRNTAGSASSNIGGSAMSNIAGSQVSSQEAQEERYDELYNRGLQAFTQMQTATNLQQSNVYAGQLVEIAYKLFEIDSARSEAYKLLGSAFMIRGNYAMAEEYGQKAIDRGGSLGFNVWHLAGAPHPEILYVGKNYITVESNQKFFEFNSSQILQVAPQGVYNLPNGSSVPVLGIATSKDGRNDAWYFAGASGTPGELQMIMNLIKKNASGGR